jgi:outer membrane protein TolC
VSRIDLRKFVTVWLLVTAGATFELRAADVLTVQEAIARALAKNPELAIDLPAQEAARLELHARRAGYFPRLDIEQLYTGGNNPVYVFGTLLSQRRFTAANFGLPSLNQPNAIDNLQTRIAAQQTLWDFGRTRRHIEQARIGTELIERGHEDHLRRVILAVLDAYYSVSLGRESWDAARVALDSAEAIMKQAKSRVGSGVAVEADLLRSTVFLASARQKEIQARGDLEVSKAQLNRLIGEPLESLPGETSALTPITLPLPDEGSLRAEQRRQRPDFLRLVAEVRQAELEIHSRQGEFLPVLGAFAAWEADNPSLGNAGGNNWTAGLSLRWNIFAGGRDSAQLAAARQRLEQKRREQAAMESSMALETRRALIQCRSAEEQVRVSAAAETQSRESLRILKNRYDAGLSTMTDLLSAEAARAAARAALAEAIYRHWVSFAQLEFAAGILSPTSRAVQP